MSITLLPTPPSRSDDPDTFIARADAFVAALNQFVAEVNATATAFATSKWVSGTTYTAGDAVWSPADLNTYRRLADGAGTTDPSADSGNWVLITAFGGAVGATGRNFIMNGAMEVDERNNGSAITPTSSVYAVDRWRTQVPVASKLTFQESTDVPTGFKNSLAITVASQYSPGSSESFQVFQCIEGINCVPLCQGTASAQQVTISFYAKASVAGTYGVFIQNSAQNRSYSFTQALTTAWARYSKTLTLDVTGTWLTTNGVGLYLGFDLGTGAALKGSANVWGAGNVPGVTGTIQFVNQVNGSTLNVTGIQLEMRSSATAFDHVEYSRELDRCARYFQKITSLGATTQFGSGQIISGTGGYIMLATGHMRTTPVVGTSGLSVTDGSDTHGITAIASAAYHGRNVAVNFVCGAASFTTGRACMLYANATSDYITIDSDF